jgi:hypothetical protein
MTSDLKLARAAEEALVGPLVHVVPSTVSWPATARTMPKFKAWLDWQDGRTVCGRDASQARTSFLRADLTCPKCRKVLLHWGLRL